MAYRQIIPIFEQFGEVNNATCSASKDIGWLENTWNIFRKLEDIRQNMLRISMAKTPKSVMAIETKQLINSLIHSKRLMKSFQEN